jgi:hypothetical protein
MAYTEIDKSKVENMRDLRLFIEPVQYIRQVILSCCERAERVNHILVILKSIC